MEWIIVAIVAAVALVCPAMMFGPMLLQRLGMRTGSSAQMSCMGMSGGDATHEESVDAMRSRRAELDREIAVLEILTSGPERRAH